MRREQCTRIASLLLYDKQVSMIYAACIYRLPRGCTVNTYEPAPRPLATTYVTPAPAATYVAPAPSYAPGTTTVIRSP